VDSPRILEGGAPVPNTGSDQTHSRQKEHNSRLLEPNGEKPHRVATQPNCSSSADSETVSKI